MIRIPCSLWSLSSNHLIVRAYIDETGSVETQNLGPIYLNIWMLYSDPSAPSAKPTRTLTNFIPTRQLDTRLDTRLESIMGAEVTLALEYLHSHHIIYRNLKPESLLLDRHGHLKSTDFGLTKELPDNMLCGTPDDLHSEVVTSFFEISKRKLHAIP